MTKYFSNDTSTLGNCIFYLSNLCFFLYFKYLLCYLKMGRYPASFPLFFVFSTNC